LTTSQRATIGKGEPNGKYGKEGGEQSQKGDARAQERDVKERPLRKDG
jgi:hypothetical protein